MGSDLPPISISFRTLRFQSTLPAWGATLAARAIFSAVLISIHAPRMGSDKTREEIKLNFIHFNPRSPHGERRTSAGNAKSSETFQSTLPAWGATAAKNYAEAWRIEFQSTLPAWGATTDSVKTIRPKTISIHAPRMGSDTLNTTSG